LLARRRSIAVYRRRIGDLSPPKCEEEEHEGAGKLSG
jgi:hypothetical protein